MAGNKYLDLTSGKVTEKRSNQTSAGAADAGKIVALGSDGKIDPSMLPSFDVQTVEAFENIGAGKYVNLFDDTGTVKMRLADNSNGRDAHGFVKTSVTAGNTEQVYFEGANAGLTGLTLGARYYLGTAGGVTATQPTAPSASIFQFLGIAVSATEINTDIDDCIGLVS